MEPELQNGLRDSVSCVPFGHRQWALGGFLRNSQSIQRKRPTFTYTMKPFSTNLRSSELLHYSTPEF